jgi:hypothetical protein
MKRDSRSRFIEALAVAFAASFVAVRVRVFVLPTFVTALAFLVKPAR